MTAPTRTDAAPVPADRRVPLTLVTVVFGAERHLLELQARSLARHLDPEVVDEVLVVDNGWRPPGAARRAAVRSAYGPLADRVRVLGAQDVTDVPATTGWRSQQILKLAVAEQVGSARYLLLDAKNHLVRPTSWADLQAADGRAHGGRHSYAEHPLRPQLERTLRYLGLDPAAHVPDFPPTATPFVMDTATVRHLVADVAARSGRPFPEEFEAAGLIEFFLYSGWMAREGVDAGALYDGVPLESPTVWPRLATAAGLEQCLAEVARTDAAFFAVHRTALARLPRPATERLVELWTERGLFDDARDARRLVAAFRRAYGGAMVTTKLRELASTRTRGGA